MELGNRLLAAKRYQEALAEYQAGYVIDHEPTFLYNIGQAQRLGGDCKSAFESYRAFLRTGPPPERAQLAQRNMDLCEPAPAPPGARTATPPPTTPAAAASQPAPAPAPATAPTPAPSIAAPHGEPSDRSPWYEDVLGDVLTLGGTVAVIIGGVLWLQARDDIDSANQGARTAANHDDFARYVAMGQDAESQQTVGGAVFLIGGALATIGIVRYWLRPAGGDAGAGVSAAVLDRGGGLMVSGRF